MLRRLTVTNFKSLDGVTFEFDNVNLFIGPNASGKSTTLQAIEVLPALLRPSITEFFRTEKGWNYRDLPHKRNLSRRMTWVAEYHLRESSASDPTIYVYEVDLQPRKHLGVDRELLRMTEPGGSPATLLDRTGRRTRILDENAGGWVEDRLWNQPCSAMRDLKDANGAFRAIVRFRSYLRRFQAFLLWNPQDLKKPWQGLAERLGPSGERLPGFWAYLQRKDPAKAAELLLMLQRIFPRLEAVQTTGKQSWGWHHLSVREAIGDKPIEYPADHASDGLLRMLAVFSLKYLPNPPRIVILEEPENGVHPHLLSEVIGHLRALADRKEPHKVQMFMTSHSPYVLNEFVDKPEGVQIFEKPKNASVPVVHRLSDRTQVPKARAVLEQSLGDLWYSGILGGGVR